MHYISKENYKRKNETPSGAIPFHATLIVVAVVETNANTFFCGALKRSFVFVSTHVLAKRGKYDLIGVDVGVASHRVAS